jgi:FtsZ-binding cell division protein ZapB
MEDEAILLKIKRQFSKDESILVLLKEIGDQRIQIGILKSELSEAKYEVERAKNVVVVEGLKTKKQWLKEDLIKSMNEEMDHIRRNNSQSKKDAETWQSKYFTLLIETKNK